MREITNEQRPSEAGRERFSAEGPTGQDSPEPSPQRPEPAGPPEPASRPKPAAPGEPPETTRKPAPGIEHEPEPDGENIVPAKDRPGTL